jgi:hypothetical protein
MTNDLVLAMCRHVEQLKVESDIAKELEMTNGHIALARIHVVEVKEALAELEDASLLYRGGGGEKGDSKGVKRAGKKKAPKGGLAMPLPAPVRKEALVEPEVFTAVGSGEAVPTYLRYGGGRFYTLLSTLKCYGYACCRVVGASRSVPSPDSS